MNTHSVGGKEGAFNAFLTLLMYTHWLTLGGPNSALGGPNSSAGHQQCQHTYTLNTCHTQQQQQSSTSCGCMPAMM